MKLGQAALIVFIIFAVVAIVFMLVLACLYCCMGAAGRRGGGGGGVPLQRSTAPAERSSMDASGKPYPKPGTDHRY